MQGTNLNLKSEFVRYRPFQFKNILSVLFFLTYLDFTYAVDMF